MAEKLSDNAGCNGETLPVPGWRQPDVAFTMSGLVLRIIALRPKRKRKAGASPHWHAFGACDFFAPIIGADCDPLVKIAVGLWVIQHPNCGFPRVSRIWHAPCNPMVNRIGRGNHAPAHPAHQPQHKEHRPMKTLSILSASLIVSLSLMAATVIVPLSATQFIA